jgi:hypothetical protein
MDDEKFLRNVDKVLEHTLDRKIEEPPRFGGEPGTPVPVVDLDDIKAVAHLFDELQRQHPGRQFGVGVEAMAQICNPGADVQAVYYRVAQLGLLKFISEQKVDIPEVQAHIAEFQSKIAPLMLDGKFTDAAFRAIARIPLVWMAPGVVSEGLPYDVEELLKLCAA